MRNFFLSPFLWVGLILLGWGGFMVLARQTDIASITWTNRLYGWMIALTYVCLWGAAIGMSPRPRGTLFSGITCTIMILVFLLCVELPAMLGFVHWDLISQRLTGNVQNYTWAFQHDRQLSFRRRPHDSWVGRPASDIESGWMLSPSIARTLSFTYDQWGYRNQVNMEQADVALIGDSYVEGAYVSDGETTAVRLHERLGRSVINLGVAGYGTLQELRVLKIDVVRFSPKVVIWCFFEGNDLYDDSRFSSFLDAAGSHEDNKLSKTRDFVDDQKWTDQLFSRSILDLFRRGSSSIFPSHVPYVGRLTVPSHVGQLIYFSDYAAVPWDDWIATRWEKARATLTKGLEFTREQNVHMLLVFVPIKFRVYHPFVNFSQDSPSRTWEVWPMAERFAVFCEMQHVPCIDLTPIFQDAVRNGGMPYSPVDSHWSPEGHALVADLLASEFTTRGWLPSIP